MSGDERREVAARLGFGCSSLGSELDYRASCRLVEVAYESGFRYFDVAPPYGLGQAERIVGDVLRPVRDTVFIASKTGIAHPRSGGRLKAVKSLLKPLKRLMPGVWNRAARAARNAAAPRGQFGVDQIEASVTESLARLRVNTLDALLLHAITPDQVNDALIAFLIRMKENGTAASLGLGTDTTSIEQIVARYPGVFSVLQSDHYRWAYSASPCDDGVIKVTHRCIAHGMTLLADPGFAARLQTRPRHRELAATLQDPEKRATLLLLAGVRANPHGRILVSSTRKDRVAGFALSLAQQDLFELAEDLHPVFLGSSGPAEWVSNALPEA